MVCAGPRWTASSCSLASSSVKSTPWSGSPARGPDLQTSVNDSMMSSNVSCRFWMALVPSTSMQVPKAVVTVPDDDDGLLHRLDEDRAGGGHGAVAGVAHGRDGLRGAAVDGVLVQLGVVEREEHAPGRVPAARRAPGD